MRNILGIVIFLMLAGCVGSAFIDSELERAEALMDERPDSALAVLQSISAADLAPGRQTALHALLLSQAFDKNYIDLTSDSVISAAVDYYSDSDDTRRKMLSYYYLARVNYNAKTYSLAIVNLLNAEKCALEINDNFYLGLIYGTFTDLYSDVYVYADALKYAKLSHERFLLTGRQRHIDWALLNCGRAHHNIKQYDKSIPLIKQAIDTAVAHCDSLMHVSALGILAKSYYANNNFKESKTAYKKLQQLSGGKLTADDYNFLGASYFKIGNVDSAAMCQNEIERLGSDMRWLSYEINRNKGDYRKAMSCLERENNRQNEILRSVIFPQDVTKTAAEYQRQDIASREKELAEERQKTLFIVAVFITVIAFILVVFYMHRKAYRAELERQIAVAQNIRNDLAQNKERQSQMQQSIEQLFKSRYDEFDKLCDAYLLNVGTKNFKYKMAERVISVINDLGSDANTLKKLAKTVNKYKDNIALKFKTEFPDFSEEEYRLFIYIVAGFSPQAISIFFNVKITAVYNRKKRLKDRIVETNSPLKEYFCERMG